MHKLRSLHHHTALYCRMINALKRSPRKRITLSNRCLCQSQCLPLLDLSDSKRRCLWQVQDSSFNAMHCKRVKRYQDNSNARLEVSLWRQKTCSGLVNSTDCQIAAVITRADPSVLPQLGLHCRRLAPGLVVPPLLLLTGHRAVPVTNHTAHNTQHTFNCQNLKKLATCSHVSRSQCQTVLHTASDCG